MSSSSILLIGGGYVGSYICDRLRSGGRSVTCVDIRDRPWVSMVGRYQDLSHDFLEGFSEIIWFAGHSSVSMAEADPVGALDNNCLDLLALARRIRPDAWLTYASTASLYSSAESPDHALSVEGDAPTAFLNAYDASKAAFDLVATRFLERTTGLRMGTVSGYSPELRRELVFNAMVGSAVSEGVVRVSNGACRRTLLFLRDLGTVLEGILDRSSGRPPIINCGSINITIRQLADAVADRYGARIEVLPESPTYSFAMDLSLAESNFGLRKAHEVDLRLEMDELVARAGRALRE